MRWFVRCRRREVEMPVGVGAVGAVIAAVRHVSRRDLRVRYRLRVRVHANGRMRCRVVEPGRTPLPYFTGRLEPAGQGVVLRGVIREARQYRFYSCVVTLLALGTAALAVWCALQRPVVWPGLIVCGIAALIAGPLSFGLRGMRVTIFPSSADELTTQMHKLFVMFAASADPCT